MDELSPTARVILGMVEAGHASGYEIKRLVDDSTRFFWAASYGQIYPELAELERRGLLKGSDEPSGARPRRAYKLTPAGRRALRSWLTRADELTYELRDEGLLKIFFSDSLDSTQRLTLLESVREHRQGVLDLLHEIEANVEIGVDEGPELVLRFGIEMHEWMVEWCERARRTLVASGRD